MSPGFNKNVRAYIQGLPRGKMPTILSVTEDALLNGEIPSRVAWMVRDIVAYRNRMQGSDPMSLGNKVKQDFLNIYFHNKGVDMINLPSILHNKRVLAAIPTFLCDFTPPIVSYSYPRTVASRIFNFKKAICNLDFDLGTTGLSCKCNTSPYVYTPAGHVVTGNLNIIRNRHVRKLLSKGPTYREQNDINWKKNEELCVEAIRKYRIKWAKKEKVDVRVLEDWEQEVVLCIKNKTL